MWLLYQALVLVLLLLVGPVLLARRGRHYLPAVRARFARRLPDGPRGAIWIHAVSVGEVGVAATLIRALPPELPLLVTTVTSTGQERAQAQLGRRAGIGYLPFELGGPVRRFFSRLAPTALVLTEGDLWPLVLREARRRALPIVVVNGRVSDRSFARLRRLRPLLGPLLDPVDAFGMQTAADCDRLLALGVPATRIEVTGNLKYETPEPPSHPELEARLLALAAGRTIVVAGSTMPGEEEAVLDALAMADPNAVMLVLAARHPERWEAVAALAASRFPATVRRSALPDTGQPPIVVLDSLGELAGLYRLAGAAFIGGTLVPRGGHNPLEAARFGVPVAVGASMENFREIAEAFDRAEAWWRVGDGRELGELWRALGADPAFGRAVGERGRRLVDENRGALDRTLALLARHLPLAAPAPTP